MYLNLSLLIHFNINDKKKHLQNPSILFDQLGLGNVTKSTRFYQLFIPKIPIKS